MFKQTGVKRYYQSGNKFTFLSEVHAFLQEQRVLIAFGHDTQQCALITWD